MKRSDTETEDISDEIGARVCEYQKPVTRLHEATAREVKFC